MIVRRIITAIKKQDWLLVSIDLTVLVVGIFLGLQVSEWNDNRKDRKEETQYLSRLHDDIVDSINQNNSRIEFMERQDNYTRTMLDDLSNCHLPTENELIFTNGLFTMGKILPAVFSRTTMDELNSTGKSLVIQNIELRKALSKHSVYIDEAVDIDSKLLLRTMPHVVEIDKKITFNLQQSRIGNEDIEPGEIIYDFQTLCTDLAFSQSIAGISSVAPGSSDTQ